MFNNVLKRFLGRPKDQKVVFDNSGATVKISVYFTKGAITIHKQTQALAIAIRMVIGSAGKIDTILVYRMDGLSDLKDLNDVYSHGKLKSILVYHQNPVPVCDVALIKKTPVDISLNGSILKCDDIEIDFTKPLLMDPLKVLFWKLSIPFMGPSTLLWPLQPEVVRTLYDIAREGKILARFDKEIVTLLEKHQYIQVHPSGEVTITKRAGKTFKVAMAAQDMRDATLRLDQCINYDVWPYVF